MKLTDNISQAISGTAIISALVITLPQPVQALTGEEINDIARNITVLIRSEKGHGSGFIISKSNNTYYVLTANHVVGSQDDYRIVTHDKEIYTIDYSKVKKLPDSDLSVVEFTSDRTYQTAKLADSSTATQGSSVFVSGWPRLTTVGNAAGGELIRQFTNGQISGFLPKSIDGYQMIYTNTTLAGMSGGPVLDTGGRVIGIHGLGDTEDQQRLVSEGMSEEVAGRVASLIKPGFNYAIPMNKFLDVVGQERIYISLDVETTPPDALGAAYVPSEETDPRDRVELKDVLGDINNTVDTIRNVCGFFRC
ncbi:MAG: serine protease [Cyanobacteria bacterium P01_G01_bin.49]